MRYGFPCDRISATTVNNGIAQGKFFGRRKTLFERAPDNNIKIGSRNGPLNIWRVFELGVNDQNTHASSRLR
jgi:hypothetical protein